MWKFRKRICFGKKYIMTSILNPTTPAQSLYNESQIRTRGSVERSYGVWKRRFPILSLGIRLNINKVQDIIVATAILPSLSDDIQEAFDFVSSVPSRGEGKEENNLTRNDLINNYFEK